MSHQPPQLPLTWQGHQYQSLLGSASPCGWGQNRSQGQLVAFTPRNGWGELPEEGPAGTGGLLGKVMIP